MIAKVFFLVDMQKDSGFGHFIRCFTLADEFKKKNIDFSFVSQKISPEIKKYFKKKKFNKFYLEKFNNFNERGKIVIIDSYIINKKTINKIGKKNFLVIFNDFNLTKLNSNIEINNNLGAKSKKFSLSKLFGNKFCIIKKEIINNKKFITKKQKIKNIYITFGGYNKKNEIIKFDQLNIDLSNLNTTTIKNPKIQETSTLSLFNCLYSNNIKSKICTKGFKKEIYPTLNRRILIPFYIPVLSLICSLLLFKSKKRYLGKFLIFLYSFVILLFTELAVRFTGINNLVLSIFIVTPFILLLIFYFSLKINFSKESVKQV